MLLFYFFSGFIFWLIEIFKLEEDICYFLLFVSSTTTESLIVAYLFKPLGSSFKDVLEGWFGTFALSGILVTLGGLMTELPFSFTVSVLADFYFFY